MRDIRKMLEDLGGEVASKFAGISLDDLPSTRTPEPVSLRVRIRHYRKAVQKAAKLPL